MFSWPRCPLPILKRFVRPVWQFLNSGSEHRDYHFLFKYFLNVPERDFLHSHSQFLPFFVQKLLEPLYEKCSLPYSPGEYERRSSYRPLNKILLPPYESYLNFGRESLLLELCSENSLKCLKFRFREFLRKLFNNGFSDYGQKNLSCF